MSFFPFRAELATGGDANLKIFPLTVYPPFRQRRPYDVHVVRREGSTFQGPINEDPKPQHRTHDEADGAHDGGAGALDRGAGAHDRGAGALNRQKLRVAGAGLWRALTYFNH